MKRRGNYGLNLPVGTPLPSSSSFAGPVVANEAAASALGGLSDGQEVFVLSHRSIWVADPNSTVTLRANEIITRSGGGRLLRTTYADPKWAQGITDAYLDLNNTTGIASNENQGIFTSAQTGNNRRPLLTWSEIYRRFFSQIINTGDTVGLVFTIHVISGKTDQSDPCTFQFTCGIDSNPRIVGEASTTTLGPVALTAFTAQNPAVPAPGGAAASLQIGATVWAAHLGKRIRRVSDGSVAVILKDLGGGVARVSQPQLTNEASFFITPTNVTWNAGDSVVVEDLTTFCFGRWDIQFANTSPLAFTEQINVLDVTMATNTGFQGGPGWSASIASGGCIIFYQCGFDRILDSAIGGVGYNSCSARQGYFDNPSAVSITPRDGSSFTGGAIFNGCRISSNGGVSGQQLGFFTYVQGSIGVLCKDFLEIGSFSVWDTVIQAVVNPAGHAILIGTQTADTHTVGACRASFASANTIFGTGAVGVGMRVGTNCDLTYSTLPNITGALGDFKLGNSTVAWWFNTATSVYNPVAGSVACTWANLGAAKGAAGLGNVAHNPDTNSHICLVSPN